ncbi:MAG: hypothetical protein M3O32_00275 [Actinomycetota bacterium]|nr:hypothetical protein [Actinomycetota bacterium]
MGAVNGGGYVGPTSGDSVTYPAPETRFVCRLCTRDTLGLTDDEWSGHTCRPACRDTRHVDWVGLPRDELMDAPPSERVARFAQEYAARGWTVTSVEVEPKAPVVLAGRHWAVHFEPSRPRW